MELSTEIDFDTHSKVATVFPLDNRGTVSAGSEVWSEAIRVQRYINLSCELNASSIPADTMIIIQTSRHLGPPSDTDWFDQDSYTWDTSCSGFKYVDALGEARWFRVKVIVGGGGDLEGLAWTLGGKNI